MCAIDPHCVHCAREICDFERLPRYNFAASARESDDSCFKHIIQAIGPRYSVHLYGVAYTNILISDT